MLLQKWFSHIVHYSAQAFRKSPLFYAIMEENWILMFFAHASKVKSNMSFLTACKFSQQVHSIWSWLQSLDVGWECSRKVPLNGKNLLWSFSVSNWVENGAHLAEKNPFWWTISVTSMLSEWTDFLSICLSVSLPELCGQTLCRVAFEFSYTWSLTPIGMGDGTFYPFVLFGPVFVSRIFIENFQNFFGGENWHQSG